MAETKKTEDPKDPAQTPEENQTPEGSQAPDAEDKPAARTRKTRSGGTELVVIGDQLTAPTGEKDKDGRDVFAVHKRGEKFTVGADHEHYVERFTGGSRPVAVKASLVEELGSLGRAAHRAVTDAAQRRERRRTGAG